MQPTRLPRKKDVVLQLLEQATVFVHLDPRAEAVRVPAWFKRQPQLVLQIGLNMAVPIPDLDVDDNGISCTLSFNRAPFYCVIPWASVFALVDDQRQGMVWPDDVPPELAAQAAQQQAKPQPAPRPELKRVPAPAEAVAATGSDGAPAKDKETAPKRRASKKTAAKAVPARAAKPSRQTEAKARTGAAKPRATPKRVAAEKATLKQAAPAAQAAQAAPAAAAGGKRKLPPYLRVVK